MKPLEMLDSRFVLRSFLTLALFIAPPAVRGDTWQATAGAQTSNKGTQALAFLPGEFWVHAGDSITWRFVTDGIHTVTFLKAGQTRPPNQAGCPGTTPDGSPFDGSACVNGGRMTNGQSYTVSFPTSGNFKLACLVHPNMTGVVHVLDPSQPLPHNQDFYNQQGADEQSRLLSDRDEHQEQDQGEGPLSGDGPSGHNVTAGTGEIVATAGGSSTVSVMRFLEPTRVIHVGETVEWNNSDPVEPHTITFGTEPPNPMPPSANVTLDNDGARHAEISSATDSAHSGFIVATPQDRTGLPASPLGVTRFRVTFRQPGVFDYICALHDQLGMKGEVVVLP
jgi:plastocyanin